MNEARFLAIVFPTLARLLHYRYLGVVFKYVSHNWQIRSSDNPAQDSFPLLVTR
jgi:oligoribonuclease (3'-5' exoribonuclease)